MVGYSNVVSKDSQVVFGVEGTFVVTKVQRFTTTSLHQREHHKGKLIVKFDCETIGVNSSLSHTHTHTHTHTPSFVFSHIDLDKIISVQEVSSAQQDKNHASFLVQCDGRTYQLQAMDEANMRK